MKYSIIDVYSFQERKENFKKMLKVIDPVLKIESCSVSDLTLEDMCFLFTKLESGVTVSSWKAFYRADGTLVINQEHKNYQEILAFCRTYMMANEEQKQEIRERETLSNRVAEVITLLDDCLRGRYIAEEMKKIDFLYMPTQSEVDVLQSMWKKYCQGQKDVRFAFGIAYMYGKTRGKREERARRKRNVKATQYSNELG